MGYMHLAGVVGSAAAGGLFGFESPLLCGVLLNLGAFALGVGIGLVTGAPQR